MTYALIGYAPFLIGSVTVLAVAIIKWYRSNGTSAPQHLRWKGRVVCVRKP
jgi:hypothetical protein